MMSNISKITLIFFLLSLCQSFIQQTTVGWRKCYLAQVDPQKTLIVQFGFPKRASQNCQYKLSIILQIAAEQQGIQPQKDLLHEGYFKCQQKRPVQLYTFKHTSKQNSFEGNYSICVYNLQDDNPTSFIQLNIKQKYNIMQYGDQDDKIPLVGSKQLINLELLAASIVKRLHYVFNNTKSTYNSNIKLQENLNEAESINITMTIIQIAFLAVYGVVWILIIQKYKK